MVAHHADQVQWTINNGKDTNVSNSVKKKNKSVRNHVFLWMKDEDEG